jgi:hypothetical protein
VACWREHGSAHKKLLMGLLYQHEIAVLGRQLPGLEPSFAQAHRAELFERAVSAFLARTDVPSLAVSHLHQELRIGRQAWPQPGDRCLSPAQRAHRRCRQDRAVLKQRSQQAPLFLASASRGSSADPSNRWARGTTTLNRAFFSVTVSGVIPVCALAGGDLAVLQLEDLVG